MGVNGSPSHTMMNISLWGPGRVRPLIPGVDPTEGVRQRKGQKNEQKKKEPREPIADTPEKVPVPKDKVGDHIDVII